jgi:trans-aconitate methyltransferase
MGTNEWDADSYDGQHSFVFEYGEDVIDLLDPADDERILDLGCGTGHLTAQIADHGAHAIGLDASADMVSEARETHSTPKFVHADACDIPFNTSFDAVFSNAALHWMTDQDAVVRSVANALRTNGRFVAELGAQGNVARIVKAVRDVAADRGYEVSNPWYFPSISTYATTLESHGLETRYATIFDRPTELDNGSEGLSDWMQLFGDELLSAVPNTEHDDVIAAVEDRLRDDYFHDGTWVADYRRLRVVAVKSER